MKQITDTLLMIRPVSFRMNEQTAVNNYYQKSLAESTSERIQELALAEFDSFVAKLRDRGVKVITIDDTPDPSTPDSIFPNNWISFHANGRIALYPMFAENRRQERREDVLESVESEGKSIEQIVDYSSAEEEGIFLEGTGSLLLDRENRIAYCALSPRADLELLIEFCEDFEYTPIWFHAYQSVGDKRELIYHTNVMMALTEKMAIVCLDAIDDKKERKNLVNALHNSGKSILAISEEQVEHFAGNMLQVIGENMERVLVMSSAAYSSLTADQKTELEKESTLLHSDLRTIEYCGGGSARCMMAEVFLPDL